MKFTVAATLIAGAAAASNVTYVTEVVTALTTFCPAPTQVTHNGVTYTITEATTLTITDCPCTISKPVYSTSVPVAPAPPASYPVSSAPVSSAPSYPTTYPNGTVSTTKPVVPTGGVTVTYPTGTATGTATPIPTAGAAKAAALSGAGLAGVLGLVAYIL